MVHAFCVSSLLETADMVRVSALLELLLLHFSRIAVAAPNDVLESRWGLDVWKPCILFLFWRVGHLKLGPCRELRQLSIAQGCKSPEVRRHEEAWGKLTHQVLTSSVGEVSIDDKHRCSAR